MTYQTPLEQKINVDLFSSPSGWETDFLLLWLVEIHHHSCFHSHSFTIIPILSLSTQTRPSKSPAQTSAEKRRHQKQDDNKYACAAAQSYSPKSSSSSASTSASATFPPPRSWSWQSWHFSSSRYSLRWEATRWWLEEMEPSIVEGNTPGAQVAIIHLLD